MGKKKPSARRDAPSAATDNAAATDTLSRLPADSNTRPHDEDSSAAASGTSAGATKTTDTKSAATAPDSSDRLPMDIKVEVSPSSALQILLGTIADIRLTFDAFSSDVNDPEFINSCLKKLDHAKATYIDSVTDRNIPALLGLSALIKRINNYPVSAPENTGVTTTSVDSAAFSAHSDDVRNNKPFPASAWKSGADLGSPRASTASAPPPPEDSAAVATTNQPYIVGQFVVYRNPDGDWFPGIITAILKDPASSTY